ncbi:M20 family metallopeptidase [Clostridium sp.]|uniref:M20 family metallopeptidase n=1 Tax=Clostridium sp. TaxID=1506 RepID=UPI003463C49B
MSSNIDFYREALKIEKEIIEIRRDFHQHPEIGFEEFRTSGKIKEFLEKEGIPYREVAGTGVCAIIEGKEKGKTIALRGDIDGLPLEDKKDASYKSKIEGRMHACGHDAHTSILLGAAKILNSHKDKIKGNVKLLFEPAEETVGGARFMIKEGVLEEPYVDCILGLHVAEQIEVGKVGIKYGVFNAASNPFTIKIKGKGGHGAHPEDTVDPIVIACHVVTALQTIVSREIAPVYPGVVTVGAIHGGTAQNIIPSEVEIKGIMRTLTNEHRELVKRRLVEITEGICKAMRGDSEIDIEESYPCLYNDDKVMNHLKISAEKVLGKENINILEHPSMGVESFAYFSNERPSAFYFLGVQNKEKGIVNPAHGCYFDIDEKSLALGIAIQCTAAFDYLTSN